MEAPQLLVPMTVAEEYEAKAALVGLMLAGRFADFPLREENLAPNSADAPRIAPHLDVENGK